MEPPRSLPMRRFLVGEGHLGTLVGLALGFALDHPPKAAVERGDLAILPGNHLRKIAWSVCRSWVTP